MTSFCKTGMLILQDEDGVLHYFDSNSTLRDIARYVWKNQSLKDYQVNAETLREKKAPSVHPEFKSEKCPRLRRPFSLYDDTYYQDVFTEQLRM